MEKLEISEAPVAWGRHFIVEMPGTALTESDRKLLSTLKPAGIALRHALTNDVEAAQRLVNEAKKLSERDAFVVALIDGAPNAAPAFAEAGANVFFGPSFDIPRSPSAPARVREIIAAAEKVSASGLLPCPHYFPGLGDAAGDPRTESQEIDSEPESLRAHELVPFRELFKNPASRLVLVTHAYFPRVDTLYPTSLSENMLRNVLREQLGFRGAAVIDSLDAPSLGELSDKPYTIGRALTAGGDLFFVEREEGDTGERALELARRIYRSFKMEKVNEEHLADSLARIEALFSSIAAR